MGLCAGESTSTMYVIIQTFRQSNNVLFKERGFRYIIVLLQKILANIYTD